MHAVDCDLIDGTIQLVCGGTAIAGPDDDVVGVGDRGTGCFSAQIPTPLSDAGAIDVGDNRFGIPEGVGEGEMVPSTIGVEAFGCRPAMVVRLCAGGAEEESGESVSFVAFETECPVLVFGCEGFGLVPSLANEVGEGIRGDGIEGNPSFNGNGFAIRKAERRGDG